MGFQTIIDNISVHPTGKGMPYELGIYARLSAMRAVDLFPAQRSHQEIIAAEGLPRIDKGRDRFIAPTIIKTFYWLVIALIALFGLSGVFSGLAAMAISPFSGFLVLLSSIAGGVVGIVFSRIVAELILIIFRINEHLGAIRDQGGMR